MRYLGRAISWEFNNKPVCLLRAAVNFDVRFAAEIQLETPSVTTSVAFRCTWASRRRDDPSSHH
jgi:hypothetical protein